MLAYIHLYKYVYGILESYLCSSAEEDTTTPTGHWEMGIHAHILSFFFFSFFFWKNHILTYRSETDSKRTPVGPSPWASPRFDDYQIGDGFGIARLY